MTIYCPVCYAAHPETDRICGRCGADLHGAEAADYTSGLIWALQHPEPTVAPRAAWILGERRDRAALEPLMNLARTSHDLGALEEAATALGKLGDEAAVPALVELLQRSYVSVRVRAAAALGAIGGADAEAALRNADSDPSPSVREAVANALAASTFAGVGK
jgi:HEAT repeat protein